MKTLDNAVGFESLELSTCASCGVMFASAVIPKRRADHKSFTCPNGHKNVYPKTRKKKAPNG